MMRCIEYLPCPADNDLWMRKLYDPRTKKSYWSYILVYVNDVLVIHHDAMSVLDKIGKYFELKTAEDPNMYLEAKLRLVTIQNSVKAWSISSSKYVQEAVRSCRK